MSGEGILRDARDMMPPESGANDAIERERAIWVMAMQRVHFRFAQLVQRYAEEDDLPDQVDADAFGLELRRFEEAIESGRIGLHDVGED